MNIQITKGFNNGDSGTTTTWSSAPCLEGKVGDGLCDDFNNKAECEFDQGKFIRYYYSRNHFTVSLKGDCCGPDVVKGSCFSCICHEDSPHDSTCEPSYIGDGYCDDFNNVPACAYDDGIAFTHKVFIPILIFLPHLRRLLFARS